MPQHLMAVQRLRKDQYVGRCSCGWEGRAASGYPFSSKEDALKAVLAHRAMHDATAGETPA